MVVVSSVGSAVGRKIRATVRGGCGWLGGVGIGKEGSRGGALDVPQARATAVSKEPPMACCGDNCSRLCDRPAQSTVATIAYNSQTKLNIT